MTGRELQGRGVGKRKESMNREGESGEGQRERQDQKKQ